jgi:hypothetical protein
MTDEQPPTGGAPPPGPWPPPGGPGHDSAPPPGPPYGRGPYGAPVHGSPPYGGPHYGGPPQGGAFPNYPYPVVQRDAPGATTSLVLGIIGLVGLFICGVLVILSPFAWYYGNRALEEIELSGGALGGHGNAKAGQIMGIIGTVLLGIGVVLLILLITAAATS